MQALRRGYGGLGYDNGTSMSRNALHSSGEQGKVAVFEQLESGTANGFLIAVKTEKGARNVVPKTVVVATVLNPTIVKYPGGDVRATMNIAVPTSIQHAGA